MKLALLFKNESIIKPLIQEGMIKLPTNLLNTAWEFVLSMTLKNCYACLEYVDTATEAQINAATNLLDRVAGSIDIEDFPSSLVHAQFSSKLFPIEVPEQYLTRYTELRGKRETTGLLKRKVDITVVYDASKFEGMTRSISGTYYAKGNIVAVQPAAFELTAEGIIELVSKVKTIQAQKHVLSLLIDQFKGTLEHELTHMLQFLVLSDFHDKQLLANEPDKSVRSDSEEYKDIYFTSPIEFDPWVKTDLTKLRALMRRKVYSPIEKRELIKKFVSSDLTQAAAHKHTGSNDPERSDFFLSLRRRNLAKWKQAAKMLTSQLGEHELL